ncbi:hypothetical protein ACP4OV_002415 [Aristida adscensionis]
MIGLSDIRDLVSSLFIMLKQNKYILFRIEFLVVLVTVLFLAMFIMDIFRRHIHSSTMKAIFSLFDAVSDSIVIYLLGAMQTAPFKNQLFPVWALVLVMFRYSVDFISGYGVPDNGGRRFTEWRNLVKLLGSAFLNKTRGSRFARPLWSLWALQIVRSAYRFRSHNLALNSALHGKSSEIISEHMRQDQDDPSKWKYEDCKPETMKGYKYLVYGEHVELQKPRYVLRIDPNSRNNQRKRNSSRDQNLSSHGDDTPSSNRITRSSLITLDRIWGNQRYLLCTGPDPNILKDNNQNLSLDCSLSRLLSCRLPCLNKSKGNIQGNDLKDLSLAFALSRLLKCRLEDIMLSEDIYCINRKLVKTRIIEEKDAKRAFRIMELQLAFVNDYFNTRYPMVFWLGLYSLCFSILQSMVTLGVVLWLSVDIRKVHKPPDGELAHLVKGINVDMIITWVFMFFIMFKEVWEIVTYILSDWTRLFLVCTYVNKKEEKPRNHCMERLISMIFKSRIIGKSWHGLMDQYVFVLSYDSRPKVWNWIHNITTGMIPKKDDGAKLCSAIDVPEFVKSEILKKLHAILEPAGSQSQTESADPDRKYEKQGTRVGRCLPRVIMSLSRGNSDRVRWYGWACFDLRTSSEVILVWHIATSLCEMALAKKHGANLSKSCKPYLIDVDEISKDKKGDSICSSNSGFLNTVLTYFRSSCTSKSKEQLSDLQERFIIANSLSRYCAYLLISKPNLIPDGFLVPKIVFQDTVKSARDDILKFCDSLESRYNKLLLEAFKAAKDSTSVKQGEDVVKQGALLGKELLDHEGEERCWEILAGVWAELLIHIAPTWNAEAHKKCLGSGGEFITNIWALLWHCGIEKSSLWPAEGHDVGTNNTDSVEQTHNAATDMRNQQVRINVRDEDGIVETEQTEERNLRTQQRGKAGRRSLEIGKVSQEVTVNDLNVQTGIPSKDK